jgi:hypothetical protein
MHGPAPARPRPGAGRGTVGARNRTSNGLERKLDKALVSRDSQCSMAVRGEGEGENRMRAARAQLAQNEKSPSRALPATSAQTSLSIFFIYTII